MFSSLFEHFADTLCVFFCYRLQDKDTPNMNRWEKKLVHEDNGALYTWEGLTTPYQKPEQIKSYPPIEMSGQDWTMGKL